MEEANGVRWECLEKGLEGRNRKVFKITFTICPVLKSKLTGLGLPFCLALSTLSVDITGPSWSCSQNPLKGTRCPDSKSLCRQRSPNQTKLKSKSPGLLGKVFPGNFSSPPEVSQGKETRKIMWLLSKSG